MFCSVCEKDKGESFYANDRTCKDCRKAKVRANRLKNIEYYRAYDRKRGARQTIDYVREYREKNVNKYKAHSMVNNAVRDGKLEREPCEMCGIWESVHAHHDDYSQPLNVRWLCSKHHVNWHMINGEAANG